MTDSKKKYSSQTKLVLFKQNFKFSSAHFLIFDSQNAEMLHGHNYQVRVEILDQNPDSAVPSNDEGYFIDFHVLKAKIKPLLDQWDEHILLPANHPDIVINKISIQQLQQIFPRSGVNLKQHLQIYFRDRIYLFPENEVCLLPVNNTSVENLSSLLAKNILDVLTELNVKTVQVLVEETPGQGACTTVMAP